MKTITIIMVLLITSICYPLSFAGGTGTSTNPYLISTAEQLNNVRNYLGSSNSDKYFKLINDIDLTIFLSTGNPGNNGGAFWEPIGITTNRFFGNIDGNGNKIVGLKINRGSMSYVGFIGQNSGSIINLGVEIDEFGEVKGMTGVGGLVGLNYGTINNCYCFGTITGSGNYIGGLIGWNWGGNVSNSYSTGLISGIDYVGGLIGNNESGIVNTCFSEASANGRNYIGGCLGRNSSSQTYNCYSTGEVSGESEVGGFVGDNISSGNISRCFSRGNVLGSGNVGGFVGNLSSSAKILNCYSISTVNRKSGATSTNIGGFCGMIFNSFIEKSFSKGGVYYINSTNPTNNGFIGQEYGTNTYSANYFDNEASNQSTTIGATGKNTAEMTTQALSSPNIYLSSGWDFIGESSNGTDEIWNIGNGRNNGYPYLDWQYPNDPASTSAIHATQSLPLGDPDPAPIVFTGTGVTIDFSDVSGATGADDITISKYNEAPTVLTGAIGSEVNIAGTSFLFTNNSGFTFTSTIQFLVSDIPGVNTALLADLNNSDATDIKFWKRPEYGSGEFTNLGFLLYYNGADGTNGTADDYLYLEGVTSFSEFTFSSGTHVLPVELTSFTASVSESKVTLNWQTATEMNNYGFEIERASIKLSTGSVVSGQRSVVSGQQTDDWKKIGFVQGHGNNNSVIDYLFVDENVISGKYYYRLKQIDNDGSFSYSEIVSVKIGELPTIFELSQNYPNPFNPSTKIKFAIPLSASNFLVTLKVYDVMGREVTTLVNEQKPVGEYEVIFNGDELSSGVYFYKITVNEFISTKKLIILK